jgi:hypothetical protein
MLGRRALLVCMIAAAAVTVARSGHELPIYPSYYPHEIELAALTVEGAAERLLAGKIQAYIGNQPRFTGAPPAAVDHVESLGAFVVVRVSPASPLLRAGRSACSIVEAVVRDVAAQNASALTVHPYPVTPFHGDYLHHVDLADAAKARMVEKRPEAAGADLQGLKVAADTPLARSLVKPEWLADRSPADADLVEVDAAKMAAAAGYATNGWTGPAWIKAGWYHAVLLHDGRSRDDAAAGLIEASLRRLQSAGYDNAAERINIERSLVTALSADCRTHVIGYTVRREYFSTVFTSGIENIAYDSLAGFNSPMFVRTVKLKDFPWNGWLALGIDARPAAAWNPIAGFTDDFGRLMWSAVGDPGLLPEPNGSAWMLNRISDVQSSMSPPSR